MYKGEKWWCSKPGRVHNVRFFAINYHNPPSPKKGDSPLTNNGINNTEDDTHMEEEKYARVIEYFFHFPLGDEESNPIQMLT